MKYDFLIIGSGLFGGRLSEYKYYDMNQVIESSLSLISDIKLKLKNNDKKKNNN